MAGGLDVTTPLVTLREDEPPPLSDRHTWQVAWMSQHLCHTWRTLIRDRGVDFALQLPQHSFWFVEFLPVC